MLLSMPCNASHSYSSEAALHWAWSTTRSVHCALANDKLLSLSEKTVIRVMMITTIIWMMVCIFSELSSRCVCEDSLALATEAVN